MPKIELTAVDHPFWTEIHTLGSRWIINPIYQRYYRMPMEGKERGNPDWGNEKAGFLQDYTWHDYIEYEITEACFDYEFDEKLHLHIIVQDEDSKLRRICHAPDPEVIHAGKDDPSLRSRISEYWKVVGGAHYDTGV